MCLKTRVPFVHIGLDSAPDTTKLCVLCHEIKPVAQLTAGQLYASKEQAFACNEHMWNKAGWLKGWALFEIKQLQSLAEEQVLKEEINQILEVRPLPRLTDLANDVAYHLQVRKNVGKALIIAPKPAIFLAVLRKRWLKIVRILQRERASTLDVQLIERLVGDIKRMQTFYFVCGLPEDYPDADVYIVTPAQAAATKDYATLYLCTSDLLLEQFLQFAQTIVTYR